MATFSPGSGRLIDAPAGLPRPPPAPGGLLFERYRLEERLGEGGMAEVWRAHDEHLDREVAIKLLHRHLLPDDVSRERFAAEARAVAGLSHPGIVTVHDIVVDDYQAAMVLELVDGDTLSDVVARRGRMPEVAAASITAQIAHALQAAHDRGLVHRDVKPANVLLSSDGRARLVDFGIARALDEQEAGLTQPGTIMGTLRYMAPEQLADGAADRATDVFGLGSLLYEMLVARPPFPAATPAALMAQQRQGAPQILSVSPELAGVARTALQHDVERRPRSAGQMAAMLERWLEHRGVSSADLPVVAAAAMSGRPMSRPAPFVMPTAAITPAPIVEPAPSEAAGDAAAAPPRSSRRKKATPATSTVVAPTLFAADGAAAAAAPEPMPASPPPVADAPKAAAAQPQPAREPVALIDPAAVTATRTSPFMLGGRRVPLITAVGLAGLLLVALLLAGALTALQAGSQRVGASSPPSHAAVSAPPTPSATPRLTDAPVVQAAPVKVTPPKPERPKPKDHKAREDGP